MGRPTKYDADYHPRSALEMASQGLIVAEMAATWGVAKSTVYEWRGKHPEFSDALKTGADNVDDQIEKALYNKALDGDTTAMIFWLKNRRSNTWRDRHIQKLEGEVKIDYSDAAREVLDRLGECDSDHSSQE